MNRYQVYSVIHAVVVLLVGWLYAVHVTDAMIGDWLKEEREAINSDIRERTRRSVFSKFLCGLKL